MNGKLPLTGAAVRILTEGYRSWFSSDIPEDFITLEALADEDHDVPSLEEALSYLKDHGLVRQSGLFAYRLSGAGLRSIEGNHRAFGVRRSVVMQRRSERKRMLKLLSERKESVLDPSDVQTFLGEHDFQEGLANLLYLHEAAGHVEILGMNYDLVRLTSDGVAAAGLDDHVELGLGVDHEPLLDRLRELGFEVAAGHLEQAAGSRDAGQWTASNAQLRTFLEAMFDDCAARLLEVPAKPGGASRKALEDKKHFTSIEGRWLEGTMAFAGSKGSHKGIANDAENLIRMNTSIALAWHFLLSWGTQLEKDEE